VPLTPFPSPQGQESTWAKPYARPLPSRRHTLAQPTLSSCAASGYWEQAMHTHRTQDSECCQLLHTVVKFLIGLLHASFRVQTVEMTLSRISKAQNCAEFQGSTKNPDQMFSASKSETIRSLEECTLGRAACFHNRGKGVLVWHTHCNFWLPCADFGPEIQWNGQKNTT